LPLSDYLNTKRSFKNRMSEPQKEPTEKEFKNWLHRGKARNEISDTDVPAEVAWAFLCDRARIPSSSRCCAIRAVGCHAETKSGTCSKDEYGCWSEGIGGTEVADELLKVRDGVRKWVSNGLKFYVPPKKQKKKNRFDTVLSGFK